MGGKARSGAAGVPGEANTVIRVLKNTKTGDGLTVRPTREGPGEGGRWEGRVEGEGFGSEGGTRSSFQNKEQEREGGRVREAEEPRKQAEGRLGLNPASTPADGVPLGRNSPP